MTTSDAPPFFVVGSGRSGTTMLRLILDANPELAVPFESQFIDSVVAGWSKFAPRGRLDTDRLLDSIGRRVGRMNISVEDVRARLEALPEPVEAGAAIETVFRSYADAEGKPRWGDKTPRYARHIPMLDRTFPGCRIVHLIRDGRDVALSYLDQPFGPSTTWDAAIHWETSVSLARRDGTPLGTDRYLEVFYEDVVADPKAELPRLCGFLEVEFSDEMLDFHRDPQGKLPEPERKPQWRGLYRPVESGWRDWRTAMTKSDQEAFEAIAGDLLGELNYERRYPDTSASMRAQAFLARRRRDLRGARIHARTAIRARVGSRR